MRSNAAMIKNLQKALGTKGVKVLYDARQPFYSKEQKRAVNKYHVKMVTDKEKTIEVFSTYSQIQVVLFLRDLWDKTNGRPLDTKNEKWNEIRKDIDILNEG